MKAKRKKAKVTVRPRQYIQTRHAWELASLVFSPTRIVFPSGLCSLMYYLHSIGAISSKQHMEIQADIQKEGDRLGWPAGAFIWPPGRNTDRAAFARMKEKEART